MEKRIVECVPNFSEGRDKAIIRQITSAIESSGGVKLLDVDPGEATNRTVVTFVGSPEAVVEAAFAGVKRAAELIDMRKHKGAHPRMGATDVLPLIPAPMTRTCVFKRCCVILPSFEKRPCFVHIGKGAARPPETCSG